VVRGEVEELKLRARGDLVVGGGDLGAAFMDQDLIDEYRIYAFSGTNDSGPVEGASHGNR
jgi:dihydrofolate reductase